MDVFHINTECCKISVFCSPEFLYSYYYYYLFSVLLRQNPHNVHEWHKRVELLTGKPTEVGVIVYKITDVLKCANYLPVLSQLLDHLIEVLVPAKYIVVTTYQKMVAVLNYN